LPNASSCMFVLPRMTAPASISFCPAGALSVGTKPRRAGVPAVFGSPATCVLSFTTSGTPWRWPTVLPAARSASARLAAASALSRSSVMYTLRSGLASARARYACVSSALVTCLSRIRRAASATPSWVRSAGRWRAVAHPAAASASVSATMVERGRMVVSLAERHPSRSCSVTQLSCAAIPRAAGRATARYLPALLPVSERDGRRVSPRQRADVPAGVTAAPAEVEVPDRHAVRPEAGNRPQREQLREHEGPVEDVAARHVETLLDAGWREDHAGGDDA